MDKTKPWYASRTILAIAAALVLQLARRLGLDIAPDDAHEIAGMIIDLASAFCAAAAIHGRVAARASIGGKAAQGGAR